MEQISKKLMSWASILDDLVEIQHVLRQIVNVKGD